MARPTIENIRTLGDFAPLFRWNLQFVAPTGVSGLPDSEKLNLRCESATVPKATNNQFQVQLRGHKVNQPGIMEYAGTITLTFVETVDKTILNFIKNWREALWATETGASKASKAQLQGQIILTQLDNQDAEIWQYTLIGAIISDYELGTLDGSTGDAMKPNITVTFDYFKDEPKG